LGQLQTASSKQIYFYNYKQKKTAKKRLDLLVNQYKLTAKVQDNS